MTTTAESRSERVVNSGAHVDVNPAGAVSRNAGYQPSHTVIRYEGCDLTYAELDDRAARLAGVLVEGGVERGDRVAYAGFNSPAFLVTMLACFRMGAIFVPCNFRLAGQELLHILNAAGAVAIIGEESLRKTVDSVRESTALRQFLLVDDDPQVPAPEESATGWEPWSEALARTQPVTAVVPAEFDDRAVLMFTSGTTGYPKGVILTYGNLWWNSVNVDTRLDTRRGDVTYGVAPLFHIGALNSFVIRTLVRGGTVVLRRTFDPARALEDLVEFRVNSMFAVPAMLAGLSRLPDLFAADLSELRAVVVAGAPVPPSLIEEFAGHSILLQQAWGLTETAPFATHLPAERTLDKVGSAGIPMPYTEVRIVDVVSGESVPNGTAGEIVVRGPNVTPGYWENPTATSDAIDRDGWFHSGDIGYLDDDGFLFIVDRLKDMIITGGENVYPAEVERALAGMPGVVDVAVVGSEDSEWGEVVTAVIAITATETMTLDEVRDFAATRVARYKLPKRIKIVDQVPRNASGKLEKLTIRKMLEGGN